MTERSQFLLSELGWLGLEEFLGLRVRARRGGAEIPSWV